MQIFWILLAIFVSHLVAGCGSKFFTGISSDYPDSWPLVLSKKQGCPEIDGKYIDAGTYSYKRSSRFSVESLSYQFGVRFRDKKPTVVELSQPENGKLYITVTADDSSIEKKELSRSSGDYECKSGVLWLSSHDSTSVDGVGLSSREIQLGFIRAEDGSLIGKEKLSSKGLVMWAVPVGANQIFWYLWKPVKR